MTTTKKRPFTNVIRCVRHLLQQNISCLVRFSLQRREGFVEVSGENQKVIDRKYRIL